VVANGLSFSLSGNVTANTGGFFVANATGLIHAPTVNGATHSVGTTFVANSSVVLVASGNSIVNSSGYFVANATGLVNAPTVNAATHSVGTAFTANSTLVNTAAINVVGRVNTATLFAATSANVGANVQITTGGITLGNGTSLALESVTISNSTGNSTLTATTLKVAGGFNVNATLANAAALNVVGQVNAATMYATSTVNVAANVQINATSIKVVNTIISNTQVIVGNSSVYANLTLSGLSISNGSQTAVFSVPSAGQYSATNVFLHANGSWVVVPGNPPAGSNTWVQFNDSGVDGASVGFTFDKESNNLVVANTVTATNRLVSDLVVSPVMRTADGPANLVANSSVLKISNSTVNTALILPTVAEYGATNVFLHANGTWASVPGTPPGGSTSHVQYNNAGALAGGAGFTFTATGNIVYIANTLNVSTANTVAVNATTTVAVGANVVANTSMLKIGNNSVYFTANSIQLVMNRTTGTSSVDDIVATDGAQWIRFNSNPTAALYNPLVSAGDNLLAYSKSGQDTGVLVIAPYATTSKGIKIDAAGNVAIGQASATSKLTVAGNIQATGNVGGTYVTGNGSALTSTKWNGASYTVSTSAPSGGNDGDFWFERVA
jgi:adhesin/invasin